MFDVAIASDGTMELVGDGKWHHLKTHPQYFAPMAVGIKEFEFRTDDRGFKVGDHLVLEEWNPDTEEHTGRVVVRRVTYIARGGVIPEGFCVMQVERSL